MEAKVKQEAASARVDEFGHKEQIALEKVKAAQHAVVQAGKEVAARRVAVAEQETALAVLASEGELRLKEADMRKTLADAAEAANAAKKALEEAKMKEKEAKEALKARRANLAIEDGAVQ